MSAQDERDPNFSAECFHGIFSTNMSPFIFYIGSSTKGSSTPRNAIMMDSDNADKTCYIIIAIS
jgi:hypothetical protein